MANADLTAARLRELLHYDPETGHFTRKVRTAQRHKVGDRADLLIKSGSNAGYYRVAIDSRRYTAHRLAWFYVYGLWPTNDVDHKDSDPGNNRIDNLRDVSNLVNRENMRKARVNNLTGLLGVSTHAPGVFRASVHVSGKRIHVGLFDTPEAAHAAYVLAKRKLHKGCTL